MCLEVVDVLKRKAIWIEPIHATYYLDEPAACRLRLIVKESCFLPLSKNFLLRSNNPILHEVYSTRVRNLAKKYI